MGFSVSIFSLLTSASPERQTIHPLTQLGRGEKCLATFLDTLVLVLTQEDVEADTGSPKRGSYQFLWPGPNLCTKQRLLWESRLSPLSE